MKGILEAVSEQKPANMSLLAGLFEETGESESSLSTRSTKAYSMPVAPRNNTNLCGIYNQGATCYLNSLLQSLLMTPEFRGETVLSKT